MEESNEWEWCSFKEGDIVRLTRGWKGAIGTIAGIFQIIPYDCVEYRVVIEGDDKKDWLIVDEDDIVKVDFSYIETGNEISLAKPSFQVGDVVTTCGQDELWVVSEVIIVNTGETAKYLYEVTPFYSDGEACTYEENLLEYQYHDTTWEEYFTAAESTELPPWRGELYTLQELEYRYDRSFRNDTLQPGYLEYIMEEYSMYYRIGTVFASSKNTRDIRGIFNMDGKRLGESITSILDKISKRNSSELNSDINKKVSNINKLNFNGLELSIISEIDKRDFWLGQSRDHYPVEMTDLQIMQAIKEAYLKAHKVGKRKLQTYVRRLPHGWVIKPVKGSVLYEGVSKKGLVIRFWYNFDLNLIETAYPIRTNSNDKKC